MKRRRRSSLLGMRFLTGCAVLQAGSRLAETFCFAIWIFSYHRRESWTLTPCVRGSTPTGLMNSVLIENNRSHGNDSDHR